MSYRYFVVDTETTDATEDRGVCEVGWVELDTDGQIIDERQSLIDPEQPISPAASGVHHITNKDVADSPSLEEYFSVKHPTCYGSSIAGNSIVVGHKVDFDLYTLQPYFDHVPATICTLRWARRLWPEAPDHKLSTLTYFLNLTPNVNAHRVMADIYATHELLLLILKETGTSLDELAARGMEPMEVKFMPFGKHKGKEVRHVDKGYLKWLLAQEGVDPDLRYTAELVMNDKL